MVALNQTKEEAEQSTMRAVQIAIREGKKITSQVVLAQCLAIGRPVLDSKWDYEINKDAEVSDDDEYDNSDDFRRNRGFFLDLSCRNKR